MHSKAQDGFALGGKTFGYDNHRISKGHAEHRINEDEAVVVREIYTRFADGEGLRSIALALNARGIPAPRAQQGRPNGWSASTIRAVLERPLYRGIYSYGKMRKAFHHELGTARAHREKGMIPAPQEDLTQSTEWADRLRIIPADLAERVDARRHDKHRRYQASLAKGGRVPERAHGKYLLSGGLLVCPQCGAHFEARTAPWKGHRNVYICSTRRRKPGCCSNTLALPIAQTDDDVLSIVEGEVLGTAFIEELLALVDKGDTDQTARITADRDRLRDEVNHLVASLAAGVPAETLAPAIRERDTAIARLEVDLRKPRQVRPDLDQLRAALDQRAADWKDQLRAEPAVARLLLRRLVGPMTLWMESETGARWEAETTTELLNGLVQLVASPEGFEPSLPA